MVQASGRFLVNAYESADASVAQAAYGRSCVPFVRARSKLNAGAKLVQRGPSYAIWGYI